MNTEQNTHAGFSNIRVFSRAILLLAAFILQPSSLSHLLASDVFIAKGTNRTMDVTLSSVPPGAGAYTNALKLSATQTEGAPDVTFPELTNGLAPNVAGGLSVKVQGEQASTTKDGTALLARNLPETVTLGQTNLTVFAVENITRPEIWWWHCNQCPAEYPLWWDWQYSGIGLDLLPEGTGVVGTLWLWVGDDPVYGADGQQKAGDHYLFSRVVMPDYYTVLAPDTITAEWIIDGQTASDTLEIVLDVGRDHYVGLDIEDGFDHVCTNGVHSSHDVTITPSGECPYGLPVILRIVQTGSPAGDAVFQYPDYGDDHAMTINPDWPLDVTVLGVTPGGNLQIQAEAATGCPYHPLDVQPFAVFDAGLLTLTDLARVTNMVTDSTQFGETQCFTNTLYVPQLSNDTAELAIGLFWTPAGEKAEAFKWNIVQTNGVYYGMEWNACDGDFSGGSITSVWSATEDSTTREFRVNAWFDCDGEDWLPGSDEPQRQLHLAVVNTEKLTLTDAGNTSNLVEDVTWAMEDMNPSNTLYLCESSNGMAQMQVNLDWLPSNVSNGWFRWSIRQTNGADTAQWGVDMGGLFANNPITLTWTNVASGESNRAFRVTGWYDSDGDAAIDPWEPRRRAYVVVLNCQFLDASKNETNALKVGKWENGFDAGPAVKDDFIDLDPDRFYVRINDQSKKGSGKVSVKLSTDSAGTDYDDDATEIELNEEPANSGIFISTNILMVSDDVDDVFTNPNVVADDTKNDRTHKIALGGKVKVQYPETGTVICEKEANVPPSLKTIDVDIIILRDKPAAMGGVPVIAVATVSNFWKIAKERYAQVGGDIQWTGPTVVDPPTGVDLSDGLLTLNSSTSTVLAAEAKSLIAVNGTTNTTDDIHVFYVNDVMVGAGPVGGLAVADFYFDESDDAYTYNVFVCNSTLSPWGGYAAVHELTHLTTDAGHPTTNTWRLMQGAVLTTTEATGSRRLTTSEETTIRGNSHVH